MQEGMLLIVVVGSVKRRRGRSTGERVVHRVHLPILYLDDVCVEWIGDPGSRWIL